MPAGRPSVLTKELIDRATIHLSKVPTLYTLAGHLNVAYKTVDRWLKAGEDELARRDRGSAPKPELDNHVLFCLAVKNARTQFIEEQVMRIKDMPLGWAALMTLLQRMFPSEWGGERAEMKMIRKEVNAWKKMMASRGGDSP